MAETFSSPAALRKAQREVVEYHQFQALSQTLVEVKEKICQLRRVEGGADAFCELYFRAGRVAQTGGGSWRYRTQGGRVL